MKINNLEIFNNTKVDDYGVQNEIFTLDKFKLCEYICHSKEVKNYLKNLDILLKDIIKLFN